MVNEITGTRLFWQYDAARSWLAPWRITFVADDRGSLPPADILTTLTHCEKHRLLLVEVAFDFTKESGVDQHFVLGHGVFGKSRPRPDRGGAGQLRYGSRTSATLVRAYRKATINRYRVELELHSRFLRSQGLNEFRQLKDLERMLLPSRFRLAALDWGGLDRYLHGRLGEKSQSVLGLVRAKSTSIHAACEFLRQTGMPNVHRFLKPLPQSAQLQDAINIWATAFEEAVR